MDIATSLPLLLGLAWLLPLASFALIVLAGPKLGHHGRGAGFVATGAILASCVLSLAALGIWLGYHPVVAPQEHAATADAGEAAHEAHAAAAESPHVNGEWYTVAEFGSLRMSIGYYIDSLTVAMFVMVTLIASCIHVYSFGYMHEELHEVTDPLVQVNGQPFKRRGRFHRFFQYLSLFCFSMLGLVVAGNVFMVFVFWELVGICSYFLIGFYIERQSASRAANKAFITNRVGDFGMLVGLMALWGSLGTLSFGDAPGGTRPGIFSQVRPAASEHALIVPDGMVRVDARQEIAEIYRTAPTPAAAEAQVTAMLPKWREAGYGQWLLVVAGLGIFCGCVGKSAQFPLHVWLPDAMEGPTPVSALIHAATMVAAGVYLVGRFFPVFTPDVMLVIGYIGCITLFVAATIAITATDIKRVLAYSTVSQLGYMMLALGVGGWLAGLFHLFTHAFFKSLLFLCSGSVIHATGTNEMPQMGGLRKKMPWTAYTMLVGCLAIAGAGIPVVSIGLSGYYSKDSILAQVFSYRQYNTMDGWIFTVAAFGGAAITAFYMFRLWYMTFAGEPRDKHIFEHAHESPKVMYVPLVILAFFAIVVGWTLWSDLSLTNLLEQARPLGTEGNATALSQLGVEVPAEHLSHASAIHLPVSLYAIGAALIGFLFATLCYGWRKFDPAEAAREFPRIYWFLRNKWCFDELYQLIFIRPVLRVSGWIAALDKQGIDGLVDGAARVARGISSLDDWIDRTLVDGVINGTATVCYAVGLWLRTFQTGKLRQYVLLIAVGTVALFVLIGLYWNYAVAG